MVFGVVALFLCAEKSQFLWNYHLGLGLGLAVINREALNNHGFNRIDSYLSLMAYMSRGRLSGLVWQVDLWGQGPRTLLICFSILHDFLLRVTSWTKVAAGVQLLHLHSN